MSALRTRIGLIATAGLMAVGATIGLAGTAASASAAVPACGNTLTMSHTPSNGATGHGSFVVLYRNVGATCTLRGYPGLDALNSAGHLMAHAQRTLHGFAGGAAAVNTITVPQGGYASATVEWMNFNPVTSGNCAFSTFISTTAANTTRSARLEGSVSLCGLQVHPTVAGTSGYTGFALAYIAWEQGSAASSAQHAIYWSRAAADLSSGGVTFSTEAAELHQLIALPDTNQTPPQNATYRHDVAELNAFFGTPGRY
jgi:hypothetical protein